MRRRVPALIIGGLLSGSGSETMPRRSMVALSAEPPCGATSKAEASNPTGAGGRSGLRSSSGLKRNDARDSPG